MAPSPLTSSNKLILCLHCLVIIGFCFVLFSPRWFHFSGSTF